jgi:hypothetical protein
MALEAKLSMSHETRRGAARIGATHTIGQGEACRRPILNRPLADRADKLLCKRGRNFVDYRAVYIVPVVVWRWRVPCHHF